MLTVCFGVDPINRKITALTARGGGFGSSLTPDPAFEVLPLDERAFVENELSYAALVNTFLTPWAEKNPNESYNVFLVLPDTLAAMDLVPLPMISRSKLGEALKVEIEKLHKNAAELDYSAELLFADKKTASFWVSFFRKADKTALTAAFARHRQFTLKGATFDSNALADAALALFPKLRRQDFAAVDVQADRTLIALVRRESTLGFLTLPLGASLLGQGGRHELSAAEQAVQEAKRQDMIRRGLLEEAVEETEEEQVRRSGSNKDRLAEDFAPVYRRIVGTLQNAREDIPGFQPETVLINLPEEAGFLTERMSRETGWSFAPFFTGEAPHRGCLPLLGGLSLGQFNKNLNLVG